MKPSEQLGAQWRPVVGYEGSYEVSSTGRVRSLDKVASGQRFSRLVKGRELNPHRTRTGYMRVGLRKDGRTRQHLVHRLVASAFIGVPTSQLAVNHKDGDKTNNSAENLEWVTWEQNQHHAERTGLARKATGERAGGSKLTAEQVAYIRARHAVGESNKSALAREYGVSHTAINKILSGKSWKHQPKPTALGINDTEGGE